MGQNGGGKKKEGWNPSGAHLSLKQGGYTINITGIKGEEVIRAKTR